MLGSPSTSAYYRLDIPHPRNVSVSDSRLVLDLGIFSSNEIFRGIRYKSKQQIYLCNIYIFYINMCIFI